MQVAERPDQFLFFKTFFFARIPFFLFRGGGGGQCGEIAKRTDIFMIDDFYEGYFFDP